MQRAGDLAELRYHWKDSGQAYHRRGGGRAGAKRAGGIPKGDESRSPRTRGGKRRWCRQDALEIDYSCASSAGSKFPELKPRGLTAQRASTPSIGSFWVMTQPPVQPPMTWFVGGCRTLYR